MMVAGTHFPHDADPADVAWKLVGVNLSDLAAKGARPLGVLLGFMLGDAAWDHAFLAGLADALRRHDTALWGGDTVSAPADRPDTARAIGLTAIGRATHLPVPSRSGAQPGDGLWVTGSIGAAMLGYRLDRLGGTDPSEALARFRRPAPRLAEGQALAPQVSAMMDVSDGLLLDAHRLATASGVTLSIDRLAIPYAPDLIAATADPDDFDAALRWGDDYELLFTLAAGVVPAAPATRIGTVDARGATPLLLDGDRVDDSMALGWEHGA